MAGQDVLRQQAVQCGQKELWAYRKKVRPDTKSGREFCKLGVQKVDWHQIFKHFNDGPGQVAQLIQVSSWYAKDASLISNQEKLQETTNVWVSGCNKLMLLFSSLPLPLKKFFFNKWKILYHPVLAIN